MMPAYKKKGFTIGLVVFALMLFMPAPEGLTQDAWKVAAIVALMAIWWATEAIPVPVTALLPLALFPLFQITSFKSAALPYANPKHIYLGGFMLAIAIERSGLHKRMALKMILAAGSSGMKLIGGFMLCSSSHKYVRYEYFNYFDVITNWFSGLFGCCNNYSRVK